MVLALAAGCAAAPARVAAPAAFSLPPVELTTLEGQRTGLAATLNGRVAVVSLWATWCQACAAEFDALSRLADRAGARGAVVLAVAVGEPRQTVAEFLKRHALSYPQLVDEEFHFADALGQKRVPATLVIDRTGNVTYVGGALDEDALAAFRRALDLPVAHR